MKIHRMTLLFILLLLLSRTIVAQADVFIKQKVHTDGFTMMGNAQPAKDEIHSTWITETFIRTDHESNSTILDIAKNVVYILDHSKKTIMEMPLSGAKGQSEETAEMRKMMETIGKGMKLSVSITPTNETKKIGAWQCKKYLQTLSTPMGPNNAEIWASEDLKIDQKLLAKLSSTTYAMMPGMKDVIDDVVKEMQKIKGMPVLTVSTMNIMGTAVKSTTELLELKEGKAPAGIFSLPSGYKKKSL